MLRSPDALAAPPSPGETCDGVAPEFVHECVSFFAEVVQVLGVPRSVGQIYGVLFASPQPLSFTDIAERLDISRGSASQGLQFLRDLGAVRTVDARDLRDEKASGPVPAVGPISELRSPNSARGGARRELYMPELKLRTLVAGVLREKVDPIVSGGGARVKRLRALAEAAPTPSGRKFSAERMKKLENWRRQMRLLLPMLKTLFGPGQT